MLRTALASTLVVSVLVVAFSIGVYVYTQVAVEVNMPVVPVEAPVPSLFQGLDDASKTIDVDTPAQGRVLPLTQ